MSVPADAPVFFAIEVAKALGYTNPSKAPKDHCKHLIKLTYNDSLEVGIECSPMEIILMPEPDLYRLIFRRIFHQKMTWRHVGR
ncbi:TPA: BRO family protein [Salmonella enterica subsp. diarizonae serovar 61:r:-]